MDIDFISIGYAMKLMGYWKKDVTPLLITGEIDGLVQERRNSIANAPELRLSCTNPSKC